MIVVPFVFSSSATLASGSTPLIVNFQGKVTTTAAGTNVADGSYAFQFKLYSALTAGTLLWTETYDGTTCAKLPVTSGVFTAQLGSCNPLTGIDFTTGSLYLTVNFAPTGTSYDGEMSPRIQMTAAPYAVSANNLAGNGRIDLAYAPSTSTYGGAAINYSPSVSAANNALLLTAGSNVTGAALNIIQNGTGGSILLGATALAGSTQTLIGTNPASFSGNFLDFQVNGTSAFKITSTGAVSAASLALGTALTVANGGTGTTSYGGTNGVVYYNGTNLTSTAAATGAQCLQTTGSGAAPAWGACGAATSWSAISAPTTNLALTMAAYTSTFTYNAATGAGVNLFNLTDTANNTGTGYLMNLSTATGSALSPFNVSAHGTSALSVGATGLVTANNFASSSAAITGGTINGTPIGATTASTGAFTSISGTTASLKSSSFVSPQLLVSDGQTASPAYPNSYLPAFSVASSETGYSRPLFFGYQNSGGTAWDSYIDAGACGSFSQMCFDFGAGSNVYTAMAPANGGNQLLIGGNSNTPGAGVDGNFANVYFGNTSYTYVPNGLYGGTGNQFQVTASGAATAASLTLSNITGSTQCLQANSSGAISGTGAGCSVRWDQILAPTTNLALSMGSNTTTFTYGAATGSANLFNLTDSNSNTGTGILLNVATGTGSTVVPFAVNAGGAGGTNTNFWVAANGNVAIQSDTNSSTAFQVLNNNAVPIFVVDTTSTNYLTNPGFEANTTGWSTDGATSITRVTTNRYNGFASLQIVNPATANTGAKTTTFNTALASTTQYTMSFYAQASGANFSTLQAGFSNTGSGETLCTLNSNAVVTTGWRRFSCTFTTGTVSGTPYIFIEQSDATSRTFYIDAVQLQTGSTVTPYYIGAEQLRGIVNSPATFGSTTNSTTAFQIQDSTGTQNLFVADTLDNEIGIGTSTPTAELTVVSAAGVAGGTGTAATAAFTVTGGAGGNSSSGSTAGGAGGAITLTSGAGGNSTGVAGTNGANITLQGGAGGTGSTAGSYGNIILQNNGGFVGIGLSGPATALDVNGAIYQRAAVANGFTNYMQTDAGASLSSTSLNPGLLVYGSGGFNYGIDLGYNSTSAQYSTRLFSSQNISFSTGSSQTSQSAFTDRMTITNGGLVGIGAPSPGAQLDVESLKTSGTLLNVAAPSAVSLAGTLIGQNINLTNFNGASGFSVYGDSITLPADAAIGAATKAGIQLALPAFTETAASSGLIDGLQLNAPGAITTSTAAGTLKWNGLDITTPTATANFAGSILTEDGLKVTVGSLTQTAGAATSNGIELNLASSTITTAGTMNGLLITMPTTIPTVGVLNAINIGTSTSATANTFDNATISIGNSATTATHNTTSLTLQNGGSGNFDLELVRGFINFQSMNTLYDDFTGKTLDTNKWTTTALGSGVCPTAPAATGLNGYLAFTTGTTAGNGCVIGTQATPANGYFQRGDNPVFETRVNTSNAGTGVRIFAGFTNATLSNSDTLVTQHAWIEKTAAGTQFICDTSDGTTESNTAFGPTISTASNYRLRVEMLGGTTPSVVCTIDDGAGNITRVSKTTNIPAATTAMDVYVNANTSDTTTETVKVDYIRAWQDDPGTDASAVAQQAAAPVTPAAAPADFTQNGLTTNAYDLPTVDAFFTRATTISKNIQVQQFYTERVTAGLEIITPKITAQGLTIDTIGALHDQVSFASAVEFIGRPYFNADTAGFATINSGDQSVTVTFTNPYLNQPIVSATITTNASSDAQPDSDPTNQQQAAQALFSSNMQYAVINKNQQGFTIYLNKAASTPITFSWIALAVKTPTTFTSSPASTPVAASNVQPTSGGDGTTSSSDDSSDDSSVSDSSSSVQGQ